jgi:HEAT repeat protein
VEPLIKALDDPSVQVRENAAVALGKIGDQRAVAPLQQVTTADVRTKKAAVGALARIDQKLGIYNRTDGQTSFFHTADEKNP